jgi:hypothetical protein
MITNTNTKTQNLDPKESSEAIIARSKRSVDRSVRALMQEMEHENTLVRESPAGTLQRVLKIFRGLKPLFAVISTLPIIPSTWRVAIVMFTQALDALAFVAPDVTAEFKAGKDL